MGGGDGRGWGSGGGEMETMYLNNSKRKGRGRVRLKTLSNWPFWGFPLIFFAQALIKVVQLVEHCPME